MIRCNKCGFSNRDTADTCIKCRTALVKEDIVVQTNPVQVNKKTIQVHYDDREPWDHPGIVKAKRSFIEPDFLSGGDSTIKDDIQEKGPENAKGESITDYFSDLSDDEAPVPPQPEESRFAAKAKFPEAENNSEPKEEEFPKAVESFEQSDVSGEKEFPVKTEVLPADNSLKNTGRPTERRFVPDRRRSGSLVALSPDEERELRTIELEAGEVLLDRETLDPSNTSISRKGHANIFYLNGSWYLENITALKTTFVQVNQPVKLKDGDVILMGDSLFKFKQS